MGGSVEISDYQRYEMAKMRAQAYITELTNGMRLQELKAIAAHVEGAVRHVDFNIKMRNGEQIR
jgi:hypothetical protein